MHLSNMSKNGVKAATTIEITHAAIVASILIVQSDVIPVVLEFVGPIWDDGRLCFTFSYYVYFLMLYLEYNAILLFVKTVI